MIKPISLPRGSPTLIGALAYPLLTYLTIVITGDVAAMRDVVEAHLP